MTRPTAILALAGLAAPAAAQSYTTDSRVAMTLLWREVNGNNNGLLEPGESADIRLDISFTNQFGLATFAPPIGSFTSGTILGYGSGFLDINGSGGTHGAFNGGWPFQTNNGTTGYGVRSNGSGANWRIPSPPGTVNATGTGITLIQFGQFVSDPHDANTMNPIARMYAFLWTPMTYAARTVTFSIAPVSGPTLASVYLRLSDQYGASVYVVPQNWDLTHVTIPIVPAPATALLTLAPFALTRRRRAGKDPPP